MLTLFKVFEFMPLISLVVLCYMLYKLSLPGRIYKEKEKQAKQYVKSLCMNYIISELWGGNRGGICSDPPPFVRKPSIIKLDTAKYKFKQYEMQEMAFKLMANAGWLADFKVIIKSDQPEVTEFHWYISELLYNRLWDILFNSDYRTFDQDKCRKLVNKLVKDMRE